jgi:hypothetical protein
MLLRRRTTLPPAPARPNVVLSDWNPRVLDEVETDLARADRAHFSVWLFRSLMFFAAVASMALASFIDPFSPLSNLLLTCGIYFWMQLIAWYGRRRPLERRLRQMCEQASSDEYLVCAQYVGGNLVTGIDHGVLVFESGWIVYSGIRSSWSVSAADIVKFGLIADRPRGIEHNMDVWIQLHDGRHRLIVTFQVLDRRHGPATSLSEAIARFDREGGIPVGAPTYPPTVAHPSVVVASDWARRWEVGIFTVGTLGWALGGVAILLGYGLKEMGWTMFQAASLCLIYWAWDLWRSRRRYPSSRRT